MIVFNQHGTVDGVAPFDPGTVKAVKKHIHTTQRPGTAVGFLTEQRDVSILNLAGGLDQQAPGTTRRVTNPIPRFGPGQLGDQFSNFQRRKELPGLFARAAGELSYKVFIGIAQDIAFAVFQLKVYFIKVAKHS